MASAQKPEKSGVRHARVDFAHASAWNGFQTFDLKHLVFGDRCHSHWCGIICDPVRRCFASREMEMSALRKEIRVPMGW
jgi:hypothetical protein